MGGSKFKTEYPPLLIGGFHFKTIAEVRALCVQGITGSVRRSLIMDRLTEVIQKLSTGGIVGELWIDGSFATEKIDPDDVDILVRVSSDQYDGDPAKKSLVDWASSQNLYDTHSCDAYKWVEYSAGHPLRGDSEDDRLYWTNHYGQSRGGDPKGIIVIKLPAVTT